MLIIRLCCLANNSLQVLNALAEALPELVGGSADLTGSNCTNLKVSYDLRGCCNGLSVVGG